MSSTLTLCVVMGLGCKADSDLDGYRPFLVDLTARYGDYGVGFLAFEHDQPDLHQTILELPGDKILTGHSNGSEETHRIDNEIAAQGGTYEALLMLDAKPKWDSFSEVAHWFSPSYQYPLPLATPNYWAFYSGFGRGFVGDANSTHLDIPHEAFPGDPRCHAKLEQFVKAWVDKQPAQPTQTVTT